MAVCLGCHILATALQAPLLLHVVPLALHIVVGDVAGGGGTFLGRVNLNGVKIPPLKVFNNDTQT